LGVVVLHQVLEKWQQKLNGIQRTGLDGTKPLGGFGEDWCKNSFWVC